jgi:hypothetical protein
VSAQPLLDVEQFVKLFDPIPAEYEDLTKFIGKHVGFSVQRAYPSTPRFKPAILKDGQPDTVALIHVLLDSESQTESKDSAPVKVRASKYSRYLAHHFDYNFEDPTSPTEESLALSKKGRQPIDLIFENEFFLDSKSGQLCQKNGALLDGKKLLDKVYDQHIASLNTLHPLRVKLASLSWIGSFAGLVETISRFLFTKALGRELVTDNEMRFLFKGYPPENVRKLSTDSIKLFEYLVPKEVAILFCALIAIFFASFHAAGLSSGYLSKIFSTPFLTITHVILLLFLLNEVVPYLLRLALNWAIVYRTNHNLPWKKK